MSALAGTADIEREVRHCERCGGEQEYNVSTWGWCRKCLIKFIGQCPPVGGKLHAAREKLLQAAYDNKDTKAAYDELLIASKAEMHELGAVEQFKNRDQRIKIQRWHEDLTTHKGRQNYDRRRSRRIEPIRAVTDPDLRPQWQRRPEYHKRNTS